MSLIFLVLRYFVENKKFMIIRKLGVTFVVGEALAIWLENYEHDSVKNIFPVEKGEKKFRLLPTKVEKRETTVVIRTVLVEWCYAQQLSSWKMKGGKDVALSFLQIIYI